MLAVQAPCDLGHAVFREPQVSEGLLEGLAAVLRLAAISCEALLRCARRRCLALTGLCASRSAGDMGKSLALGGSWMDGVKETTPRQGESVASSSRAPYFRFSFVDHLHYIQQNPRNAKQYYHR